jgi:hypothetical protein
MHRYCRREASPCTHRRRGRTSCEDSCCRHQETCHHPNTSIHWRRSGCREPQAAGRGSGVWPLEYMRFRACESHSTLCMGITSGECRRLQWNDSTASNVNRQILHAARQGLPALLHHGEVPEGVPLTKILIARWGKQIKVGCSLTCACGKYAVTVDAPCCKTGLIIR